MSYAKVTLVGNVGRDPEFKHVGDNEVCNFTFATTRVVRGEKVTSWWSVSSWSERLNKVINEYVKKGSKLMLVGEPSCRAWVNKENEAMASLEINISYGDLVLLDGRPKDTTDETSREGGKVRPTVRTPARGRVRTGASPATQKTDPDLDDDIPF